MLDMVLSTPLVTHLIEDTSSCWRVFYFGKKGLHYSCFLKKMWDIFRTAFFQIISRQIPPHLENSVLFYKKSFASLKLCPKIKNPGMGASVCKKLHIKRTAFKTWTRTLNPEKYHTEKVTHIDRANNWSFKIIHFIWKPQNLTLYGRHVQLKWVYLNVKYVS